MSRSPRQAVPDDEQSTAETVCQISDAERSAESCVTYVGVELRQRSVSGGGRVVEASADDGTSSYGDGVPLSMDTAAVLDAFSAAPRHQLRPTAWCKSTRFTSQACRATAPFARADWQATCTILASNSTGGGGHNASSNTQPAPRVNGQKPPPALEATPTPTLDEMDLVPMSNLPRPLSISDLYPAPMHGSQLHVAYQGVPGAYSKAAAAKAYPGYDAIPCDQFEVAFQAIEL
ncbi:Arogenate dehydratase/prephenate dehydratase 6, chloroplastic [Zea mays]|uniref:Arogenate dehydratase/prephenate dehydratase 6, chloroplastic n=1 Tax=Zea mays TaxID=4577 RepID=A0A3L6E4B3_MAIZE|nr:Arogenate dehydratase/prephenate dehydratase 6, chloroplastic [Zea mays]